MTSVQQNSSSAGAGERRRKGPKTLPRLPLSAFSPPNSAVSEQFPIAPSPSTLIPASIVDAHVLGTVDQWKSQAGENLGGKSDGVVLFLQGSQSEINDQVIKLKDADGPRLLSVALPFSLEEPAPSSSPLQDSGLNVPTSLSTNVKNISPDSHVTLRWALEQGRPVDIDVQLDVTDDMLESFEDLLVKATADLTSAGPIVLSNILPPPHDLTLPIVKLLNHPAYVAYQRQTAALSLFPRAYVKFLPPNWSDPTPSTPPAGASFEDATVKQNKEWKRRIKMFLGPVIEAFGIKRIIFGSSPSPASSSRSVAGDWYELAREALAELGLEQQDIDDVFAENAKTVYGSA